jgi:hypothetical protein
MVKIMQSREANEEEKRQASPWQTNFGAQAECGATGQTRQPAPVTGKILGAPSQTQGNWVRLSEMGQLKGAGDKPVSPEQMELVRLRAGVARLGMVRAIPGKATAYFAKQSL